MASPNLDEITTTTLRNRSKILADNVLKNNALLNRLSQKGKVKMVNGGRTIVQELFFAENSTFTRYSGAEPLNIDASNVISAAEYNYAQAAVAVVITGLEEIQNSGPYAVLDLLEARIENAETTMMNNISVDCYSDGTASSGKQIGGLQLLVANTPTSGTVGGINRATYTFWRNVSFDATTDGGAAATSANIQSYMNRVYVQLVRGPDRPDFIVADNNYWRLYLESLQAIQRIRDTNEGQAGFMNLKYMDADVVLDGGFQAGSTAAPTNSMYFLNTKYIFFRPASGRNMVPLNPDRFATNQDSMVKLIAFAGNMTLSNASLQGVLKD